VRRRAARATAPIVASRLAHFAAYLTAQTHDVRALLWTPGSLILIFMTLWTLVVALTG